MLNRKILAEQTQLCDTVDTLQARLRYINQRKTAVFTRIPLWSSDIRNLRTVYIASARTFKERIRSLQ